MFKHTQYPGVRLWPHFVYLCSFSLRKLTIEVNFSKIFNLVFYVISITRSLNKIETVGLKCVGYEQHLNVYRHRAELLYETGWHVFIVYFY